MSKLWRTVFPWVQKEINQQARENAIKNKEILKGLIKKFEEEKSDLEARIKHAEKVGLLSKSE